MVTNKIIDKFVGVIGLGYVGLPLIQAFWRKGFSCIGLDIDVKKVESLQKGVSPLRHLPHSFMQEMVSSGRLEINTDFSCVSRMDAILLCVPTPLTRHHEPDMQYIISTVESLSPYLREEHLIVLESTTYPGTLREVVLPILQRAKPHLEPGKDYFLGYSPEREDPGNPDFETSTIPKVVGADDEATLKRLEELYGAVIERVVPVSSSATAEAVKLTENIFRAVNIALVNELKVIYSAMRVDVWEVIEAAKTKPFGFMPFYPGPGLGGHCIPIDPFYLSWKAKEFGLTTKFIELAGQINTHMPDYVIQKIREGLDQFCERGLKGSRILIAGIAYKKNVDDMRESPALVLMEKIKKAGATLNYYDPWIPVIPSTREHEAFFGMKSLDKLSADNLSSYHASVIVTDHDDVDYETIVQHSRCVVDTRNVTRGYSKDYIVRA